MTEGGCACGAVRYALTSEPMVVHCCHCTDCQTETGSAFVVNAVIESDRVTLLAGAPDYVMTPSASGKGQEVARCPQCRVALWSHYAGSGRKSSFIRAGTLDDPGAASPDVHLFTRSKLPWVMLHDGVPAFEAFYPSSEGVGPTPAVLGGRRYWRPEDPPNGAGKKSDVERYSRHRSPLPRSERRVSAVRPLTSVRPYSSAGPVR